ncbi:MAG TPA: hypothetical protein VMY43_00160 [Methanothrix sp.]|nr:hypothetical protein [Methanothrix sp.]
MLDHSIGHTVRSPCLDLVLECLGLRQGRIRPFLQPLRIPASRWRAGGLLQGLPALADTHLVQEI